MRLGTVIGRVTLSEKEPVYRGGCLLIVQPLSREQFAHAAAHGLSAPAASAGTPNSKRAHATVRLPLAKGSSVVAFDPLGADEGSIVGFTEGAEAAQPFDGDAPVDAYIACIIDQLSYTPPAQ